MPSVGPETSGSDRDSSAAWHVHWDDLPSYLEVLRQASSPSSGPLDFLVAYPDLPFLDALVGSWSHQVGLLRAFPDLTMDDVPSVVLAGVSLPWLD